MSADITANRHGGNTESAEANGAVAAVKPTLRKRVIEYVRSCGADGATSDEIEIALGMRHQTASARITEAKQLGLLEKTGTRRPTRSGHSAAVLVAVPVCPVCEQPISGSDSEVRGAFWGSVFNPCGHRLLRRRPTVHIAPVGTEPSPDLAGWTELGHLTRDGAA